MPKNEQTSDSVGKLAAQLLNGKRFAQAEKWLESIVGNSGWATEDVANATVLLTVLEAVKSLAGSALTQRPNK